jgi:amino acid transporter
VEQMRADGQAHACMLPAIRKVKLAMRHLSALFSLPYPSSGRLFLVSLNLGMSYLNYRGLHIVGNLAMVMTVFTLLPFGMLSILGLPHVQPANWVHMEWGNVKWISFLNVMFW